jgi:hypothetical protein
MLQALSGVWALLVGIVLIMLGNGMHFTLTGLSGRIEWVSGAELAVVRPGYFLGFLSGARFTPVLIQRVGHVRDFAVLGSFMSAGLMAFTLLAGHGPGHFFGCWSDSAIRTFRMSAAKVRVPPSFPHAAPARLRVPRLGE